MKFSPQIKTRLMASPSPSSIKKEGWYSKTAHFFGFQKIYNFNLFIITAGAMLGFILAKVQYLNITGNFSKNAAIGEWYWYRGGHYKVGITLHLATCIPAGFLLIWQFVPAIRHKFLLFHRINGYLVLTLIFFSNIGVLMVMRRAFGGDRSVQSAVVTTIIMVYISLTMAYINVKRLQIDQHRAWMLRGMFYLGIIITERVLLIISALITSKTGKYFTVWSCDELNFLAAKESNNTLSYMQKNFADCFNATNPSVLIPTNQIAVNADLFSQQQENVGGALRMNFGQTVWLALVIHMIAVELYLALTPREAQRLRKTSYQRQLEAGMSKPGSAGLVVEKFGDANEWKLDEHNEMSLVSETYIDVEQSERTEH